METTGENLFQVKKERSYISCLVNGCSYGFRHLGMLLRYMWPSLVLSTVLPIPFVFFFAAQVDAILRKWIELGYLPNVTLKVMRRDVEKCANRSALKVLIYIIWLLVVFVFLLPGDGKACLLQAFQVPVNAGFHDHEAVCRKNPRCIQRPEHRHFQSGVVGRIQEDDVKACPLQGKPADRREHIRLHDRRFGLHVRMGEVFTDAGGCLAGIVHKNSPLCTAGKRFDADGARAGEQVKKTAVRDIPLQDIKQRLLDPVLRGTGIRPRDRFQKQSSGFSGNDLHVFSSCLC